MPLTAKGEKIMAALIEEYGEEKAKKVFYAGKNSGRFTGVDSEVTLTEMVSFDQDQPHFKKTADGYLVAQPRVARTGVQLYSPQEAGRPEMDRMIRVYRPEEEVFSQDTIRSFAHRPVTLNHPPEMVNDANWRKYAKGHTIDPIVRDGEFVRVPIMLMDRDIIKEFEAGRNQLSMGYTCDLKWEPGVTDDGEEYDAVQTNLRMNHLALVACARGGDKLCIGDFNPNHDPETGQFSSGGGGEGGGGRTPEEKSQTAKRILGYLQSLGHGLGEVSLFALQALLDAADQDLVHCPNCDREIPEDAEVCPECGYEMQDGEYRESVADEFYVEDYNPNHDPATGKFSSGPGGGGGGGAPARTRTRKPSTASKEEGVKALGYSFAKPFVKGGGSKHAVLFPGGGTSGPLFHTKAEAVAHAEEHAKRSGLLTEPAAAPRASPGATAAPVQGPKRPTTVSGEPDFFGTEHEIPAPHSGQRAAAATAAAVGVPAPSGEVKRGPGRARLVDPVTGYFVHPREGEPGYVGKGGGRAASTTVSGAPSFSPGRSTFPTASAARQHIRMQRRRWRWARPVRHGSTYVPRRGFGFTGARVPGLRRQVGAPYYTLHHDSLETSWGIWFDEELDLLPLTDVELTEVLDFNPNHDPVTGEFTSGSVGPSLPGASQLTSASRREAATATFSSPQAARQHATAQLQTWKQHLASQEEAVKEIKKQIAMWEKAKVRPHVEYETKQRFLLGEKRIPVRTHYTVHVDSDDLALIDAIEVEEIDLLQLKEWDQQSQLEDLRAPEMDEFAEPAAPTS